MEPSGARQDFRGSEGGVFTKPEGWEGGKEGGFALEEGGEAGVLRLLMEHAGGKTLHPTQQWVVRAMRALELRYQAAAREEGVQRFNLEVRPRAAAHTATSFSPPPEHPI